jgi:hypothetical protein
VLKGPKVDESFPLAEKEWNKDLQICEAGRKSKKGTGWSRVKKSNGIRLS